MFGINRRRGARLMIERAFPQLNQAALPLEACPFRKCHPGLGFHRETESSHNRAMLAVPHFQIHIRGWIA